jgi:hypothetical protein
MARSLPQNYQDDSALIASDPSSRDLNPEEIHARLFRLEERAYAPNVKIMKVSFHARFFGIILKNSSSAISDERPAIE